MQLEAISNPTKNNEIARPNPNEAKTEVQTKAPNVSTRAKERVQIEDLQRELADHDISLSYRHDKDANRLVISLVDKNTGETIRQIPDDVVLKLSSEIRGHFLNQTV